jgi:predicted TIM-barrel fold metal-dependent hydrolase
LVENNGYLPPDFTVENYKKKVQSYGIAGGAIVSGSFQKFDQEYLLDALKSFGKNYFGVANIPIVMKKSELERLNQSNIRAVRFNLKRGGSESLENLVELSNNLYDKYGWNTELYVDSKNLKELKTTLEKIPKFSIDHLGLSKAGLSELYYWAEKGVKIKATGFGRLDFNPTEVMKRIHSINPNSLMFGTDLPSTRAKRPFTFDHLKLIKDSFSESEQKKILYENAIKWYATI